MPAAKRRIGRRDASSAAPLLRTFWSGSEPPARAISADEREQLIAAFYLDEGRKVWARELGRQSYAANGGKSEHPFLRQWLDTLDRARPPAGYEG